MSWRAALSVAFHELRVVYCKNSNNSQGTRAFVTKYYEQLKTLNPGLPIYIRPCEGVEPMIAVRFDHGIYQTKNTSGMGPEEVLDVVKGWTEAAPKANKDLASSFGGAPAIPEPDVHINPEVEGAVPGDHVALCTDGGDDLIRVGNTPQNRRVWSRPTALVLMFWE